jgi:hypothetical protein
LLHEALVDVGALGWVVDEGLPIRLGLLEETLANALVYDDQRDLRWIVLTLLTLKETIFLLNDLVELFKLEVNYLLTHRVANTVTVDKNVVGHLALVELSVALEGSHEVVR